MHPREAYATGINTTEGKKEHCKDECGCEHTLRHRIKPRYRTAEECAYDHAQWHRYGTKCQLHLLLFFVINIMPNIVSMAL